jgi:regulatory protein
VGEDAVKKLYVPEITEQKLYEAAVRYLERYSSGVENLKRVLERRVKRFELRSKEKAPPETLSWISKAVSRCVSAGYVNDNTYTEQKIAALRRQGRSRNYIRQALQLKGISAEAITKFLSTDEADELAAAQRYVARRRLKNSTDSETQQKTLAKIVRAGFSLAVAKKALDTSSKA